MSVDREGTFSMDSDIRILYSTMLNTRAGMIVATGYVFSSLLTIALRYSTVRRQFRSISGTKKETQLIDYQTQQMKLFPYISLMFAHSFASHHVNELYR